MEKAILELSKIAIENLSVTKLILLVITIVWVAQIWQMVRQSFLIKTLVFRQQKLLNICEKKGNRSIALYLTKDKWKPDDCPDVFDEGDKK